MKRSRKLQRPSDSGELQPLKQNFIDPYINSLSNSYTAESGILVQNSFSSSPTDFISCM